MGWVWSGAFPILIGMAAIAYAAWSMAKNPDKRSSEYQISVAAIFIGLLCAFCGLVMMGSGMGTGLFFGGPRSGMGGMGMGMGGGYGMGW